VKEIEDIWWNMCIIMELQLRSLYVGYCTVCPVVSLLLVLCILLFVMF